MFPVPFTVMITWPIPNYDNPPMRSAISHYLPSAIFIFLSTICLSARLYQRIWVRRYLGIDDVFTILAFIFSIGVTIIVTIGNKYYGWNRHVWDVRPDMYESALKCLYFVRIFWSQAACFIRFSVLCLFYRLLKSISAPRHFYWVMHATLVFNVGILLFNLLAGIIPCYPIFTYWVWPPIDSKCLNESISIRLMALTNTIGELQLAILPILALSRLKIQRKQKWSVISVLSLGFLITIVGIVRTYYMWMAMYTYDMTWWSAPGWTLAEVELHLAIICASAPALRPLLSRLIRRSRESKRVSKVIKGMRHTNESMQNSSMLRFDKSQTSTITVNQAHRQADLENASEWALLMCTIDLEGIPDDGLGYTVTISGPPRAKRESKRKRCRVAALNLLHPFQDRSEPTRGRKNTSAKVLSQVIEEDQLATNNMSLHIPMTVEVEVEKAMRMEPPALFREKRWNSIGSMGTACDRSDSQSIVNIDAVMDGFDFTDFGGHLATTRTITTATRTVGTTQTRDGDSPTTLSPLSRPHTGSANVSRSASRADLIVQPKEKSWYNDDEGD